jgi:chromosome segregation ATPase
LIKTNAFKSKVTFIPIDGIIVKLPEREVVDHYHQISEGRARIAIELIEFDQKFLKVMQFVFGSAFIADDS